MIRQAEAFDAEVFGDEEPGTFTQIADRGSRERRA